MITKYVLIERAYRGVPEMIASDTPMDSSESAYHIDHDWSGPDPLPFTIVSAVAAITGREPTALPVLARHVNTDALEALFVGAPGGASNDSVQLRYADCGITIHRDGHVVIQPPVR